MKKIMICILLAFVSIETDCLSKSNNVNIIEYKKVITHFNSVYDSLRKNEGNYSNIPEDLGKETYGGITKKYNKNWYGWKYIELEKKKNGGILDRHYKVEKAELWVKDFYLDIWVKQGFYKINNFALAYYLFDTRIHHFTSPKLINRVLVDMGHSKVNITKDEWIEDWINNIDPQEFIQKLSQERVKLYYNIVKRNESQRKFLSGWLKRVEV